jgi:hypothetical protein
VGDNPFHGISHLSLERSKARDNAITNWDNAAEIVASSMKNGAQGFMFSVSETTLSVLKAIRKKRLIDGLKLYAVVPYAYEYVRLATQTGGISGIARKMVKQIILSTNLRAMAMGLKGIARLDPTDFLKAYLSYEISRIRSSSDKHSVLVSILLHEIVTDMALALDLDWIVHSYIDFMLRLKIRPGFNTRNFPFLVRKLNEWNVDLHNITIAAPFNKVGFQMDPSKTECEEALRRISGSEVIAISILAAGYLKPSEALTYIANLPNVTGVAVGVSSEKQAYETFKLLKSTFDSTRDTSGLK